MTKTIINVTDAPVYCGGSVERNGQRPGVRADRLTLTQPAPAAWSERIIHSRPRDAARLSLTLSGTVV